ncbi:MAG: hypothetical protein NTW17_03705 [Candidatus Pacearchaeota archaeon]|nr:hypothetical protein [Candidatus Pacearchaeota archaeon]
MERRIEVRGKGVENLNREYITSLFLGAGLDGNFEIQTEIIKGMPGFPGRAIITISGRVNYSQVDSILCSKGYGIIRARTRRETTLEDAFGGAI